MDGLQLQWALQDDAIELASMTQKGIEALIYPVLHPSVCEESELSASSEDFACDD